MVTGTLKIFKKENFRNLNPNDRNTYFRLQRGHVARNSARLKTPVSYETAKCLRLLL